VKRSRSKSTEQYPSIEELRTVWERGSSTWPRLIAFSDDVRHGRARQVLRGDELLVLLAVLLSWKTGDDGTTEGATIVTILALAFLAERDARASPKARLPRGREMVAGLRTLYAATGDRAFADALAAIERHGLEKLDAGALKRARAKTFGTHEAVTYFPRMKQLVERGLSVRHAAALVAVTWSIEGASFQAVTKSLSTGYREWSK
jgi:hypothetical protein